MTVSVLLLAGTGLLGCQAARPTAPGEPRNAASAKAPHAPASPGVRYVVAPGETLGAIARCSGVPIAELARDNAIPDPNRLVAGESLRLPAGHKCTHAVPPVDPAERALVAARTRANQLLTKAYASLDAADFEAALALADRCEGELADFERDRHANSIRARCRVAAGIAETGLDERERAVENFRRALDLDPGVELATDETSPRVRELMVRARETLTP